MKNDDLMMDMETDDEIPLWQQVRLFQGLYRMEYEQVFDAFLFSKMQRNLLELHTFEQSLQHA